MSFAADEEGVDLFDYGTVMIARWTPNDGITVRSSELPQPWHDAMARLGRDLRVRHYNGAIAHIDFAAVHDPMSDFVWLSSSVRPVGGHSGGLGHSGGGANVYDDEEPITVSCADLVQDQIARAGIVWPRGHTGEFLTATMVEGIATWTAPDGEHAPIGSLPAKTLPTSHFQPLLDKYFITFGLILGSSSSQVEQLQREIRPCMPQAFTPLASSDQAGLGGGEVTATTDLVEANREPVPVARDVVELDRLEPTTDIVCRSSWEVRDANAV